MRLDGRELAGYIQERHARQLAELRPVPQLAIVRQGASPATDIYLRVKQRYGQAIGLPVQLYTETPEDLLPRIEWLNQDSAVTGINVELPFADAPELQRQALEAVAPAKDVEGLGKDSSFEVVTPKAILWLLSAFNIGLQDKLIAVVGQGGLVGRPLADQLEGSDHQVRRIDIKTTDLVSTLIDADIVISATGHPNLITSAMIKSGAVVIDAGAPQPDAAEDLRARDDITLSPNPGGVGPVTVAALFDNVLLAAQRDPLSKPA